MREQRHPSDYKSERRRHNCKRCHHPILNVSAAATTFVIAAAIFVSAATHPILNVSAVAMMIVIAAAICVSDAIRFYM